MVAVHRNRQPRHSGPHKQRRQETGLLVYGAAPWDWNRWKTLCVKSHFLSLERHIQRLFRRRYHILSTRPRLLRQRQAIIHPILQKRCHWLGKSDCLCQKSIRIKSGCPDHRAQTGRRIKPPALSCKRRWRYLLKNFPTPLTQSGHILPDWTRWRAIKRLSESTTLATATIIRSKTVFSSFRKSS